MRIAWIDCFAGISGDMTLGALVDCGFPVDYLTGEIKKLGLTGFSINAETTVKNHITAQKIHITFDLAKQPDRRYLTITKMIENSGLSDNVRAKALEAFRILGQAEAKIHGIPLNAVHFHEVGAVDSIIDLVGSIIGFEYLQVENIYTSPVPLGTGLAKTEHGIMPVPSPAALEVLKGYPIVHKDSGYEMTTPTGATLVKTLSAGLMPAEYPWSVIKTGYGAGSKNTPLWPNVLRILLAEPAPVDLKDRVLVLETNIDDLNPEFFPHLMERLLSASAKDVYLTPVIMKKGRPGTLVTILSDESAVKDIENILFTETSTIGIRKYPASRTILDRQEKQINTRYGPMMVKVSTFKGQETLHPEYEQCLKIARERGVSLIEIYREIDALNTK